MEDWLIELAKGIGKMFLNPLLYWFFILTLLASIRRIKRERLNFGTKVFDVFTESKFTWAVSLISGLLISMITIGLGMEFNLGLILLLCTVAFVFSLATKFTWLSASYTFGITYLLLLIVPITVPDVIPTYWMQQLEQVNFVSFTILLSLLLIIESILLLRIRRNETFPELIKGNRGKWIGQHRLKKIAMIPFFTIVPAGAISPFADWWPFFSINGESFGLIVVPFFIGFEHVVRGSIPIKSTKELGQSIMILGLVTLGIAITGVYFAIMPIIAVVVALIGREVISYRFRANDKNKQAYFSPDPTGLLVLGVIPGTPADQLGVLVGEKIIKVNGRPVFTEPEFYEALQSSSAFCKLDLRDERGEIRFAQRALYQGEHHELGIVFAKEQYRRRKKERIG